MKMTPYKRPRRSGRVDEIPVEFIDTMTVRIGPETWVKRYVNHRTGPVHRWVTEDPVSGRSAKASSVIERFLEATVAEGRARLEAEADPCNCS